ncbi:hypothetical protein J5N97_029856 [Dioscorea zingiberensis]|uniref:Uncharacterized protein n=1 Tax=Dioscorea zingiberensis TaxID=325984 RepID=A0A9D5H3K3_9LILI|nr:hypothetical protein J5N97_029856 [Dioscorea zingiberensis]
MEPAAIVSAPNSPSSNVAISHVNPQWSPAEFASALGGSPSNVAISNVNPGVRTAFIRKIGDDDFGIVNDVVLRMNIERFQTCAMEFWQSIYNGIWNNLVNLKTR